MQYERINFSRNWNNKLLCNVFTTIKPANKKCNIDDVFDIRIDGQFYCYAKLIKFETKKISEIISFGMNFIDADMNEKEFLEFMTKKYSKNSWWEEENTEMKIVFLKKISQLTIFENGDYPIAT